MRQSVPVTSIFLTIYLGFLKKIKSLKFVSDWLSYLRTLLLEFVTYFWEIYGRVILHPSSHLKKKEHKIEVNKTLRRKYVTLIITNNIILYSIYLQYAVPFYIIPSAYRGFKNPGCFMTLCRFFHNNYWLCDKYIWKFNPPPKKRRLETCCFVRVWRSLEASNFLTTSMRSAMM
jgi:hypothetical protein